MPSLHQSITSFLNNFQSSLYSHSERVSALYLGLLFIGLATYTLAYPIIVSDTDLWYHLNGGRYFWETGSISSNTFFSFIEPEKYRTNYFWAFQALSFKIYDLFGYQGLIILKSALVLISGFFISKIIIGHEKIKAANIYQLLLIALVIYMIAIRGSTVRPHLISYTLIPIFIYVLLHRQKYIFVLPVLTVFWVNFHGVEWPVGALICGSFFLQFLKNYKDTQNKKYITYALWTLACLPAIFINPYGYKILFAPFSIDPDTYLFIKELTETEIFTHTLFMDYPSLTRGGILFVLFTISIYMIFILWMRKKLELSLVLLSISAFILLFRGQRFIWEWVFLTSPVFWMGCTLIYKEKPIKRNHITITALVLLILISPFTMWIKNLFTYNNYPYDYTKTPTPTTELIKKIGIKGKYMAPPSLAGYIQWELYPNILIHSDMEFPPFDGMDFLEARRSMTTKNGLAHIIEKYNPDYFGVYLTAKSTPKFIHDTDTFSLISFDDHIALYMNKNKHPDLSAKYQLDFIDPYDIYNAINEDNLTPYINELKKQIKFNIYSQNTLSALISYLLMDKQYKEALVYIEILKNTYSNNENISLLEGEANTKLKNYATAIRAYEKGLTNADTKLQKTLHLYLADSYYSKENYKASYKHYKKVFNPYIRQESAKHYFQYGYASLIVGDVKKSQKLLTYLVELNINDESDNLYMEKSKALLDAIKNNKFKSSFIF